jgi:hypothetical protein
MRGWIARAIIVNENGVIAARFTRSAKRRRVGSQSSKQKLGN